MASASDEAVDELLVGAPVRLEPPRRLPHHRGHLLHRAAATAGDDERHSVPGRGPSGEQVAVAVRERGGADGREQQRRGQVPAEEVHREIPAGVTAQHARDARRGVSIP